MAIIKRSTNNKCWRECKEKGTLLHSWQECKLVQPPWRIVWRFLKKLKIELPYDPAIQFLGIYLGKTIIQKDTCTPMLTVANTLRQPKRLSVDEWIKMWDIHTMEYYSATKKSNVICSNMDGPRGYHTE